VDHARCGETDPLVVGAVVVALVGAMTVPGAAIEAPRTDQVRHHGSHRLSMAVCSLRRCGGAR